MKIYSILLLFLTYVLSNASKLPTSHSKVQGPKYDNILEWEKSLKLNYPSIVTLKQYGISTLAKPLMLILVKEKTTTKQVSPCFVMTGITHGSEYLGVEDRIPSIVIERFNEPGPIREFLQRGGSFVFVPVVNPDGYVIGQRENARGIDLNRDWDLKEANYKGFKEKETSQLASALEELMKEELLKYVITIDYHCCSKTLLYPWSTTQMPPISHDKRLLFNSIGEFARNRLGVDIGSSANVLGYSSLGTTKDYFFSHYKALALTYEGRAIEERNLLDRHVRWWEDMIKWLLEAKFTRSNDKDISR